MAKYGRYGTFLMTFDRGMKFASFRRARAVDNFFLRLNCGMCVYKRHSEKVR